MAAIGTFSINSASHDFPVDSTKPQSTLCMLKYSIRSPVIDLSPPPTLTVDDAVTKGLNPRQEERDRMDQRKGGKEGRNEVKEKWNSIM